MTEVATKIRLSPEDNRRLADLCGQFDEHLRQIETALNVEIKHRGYLFEIIGNDVTSQQAVDIITSLYGDTNKKQEINSTKIHLILQTALNADTETDAHAYDEGIIKTRLEIIKPRSKNQLSLIRNIRNHDINFAIGPAGTGKTYLAVACAVSDLEQEKAQRIILTRPAVEAGERLGFLPGGLAEKIDPYLRPLYDALFEMLGYEQVSKLIDKNIIEIAPLAYMRGRTLTDAFVILDESQNTTKEQMKMLLTRIGYGSKAVITGDITQVDLPRGQTSGLRQAVQLLKDIDGIKFNYFDAKDAVRHPLVQNILHAYEENENEENEK